MAEGIDNLENFEARNDIKQWVGIQVSELCPRALKTQTEQL